MVELPLGIIIIVEVSPMFLMVAYSFFFSFLGYMKGLKSQEPRKTIGLANLVSKK
jgi:hypothetical protein